MSGPRPVFPRRSIYLVTSEQLQGTALYEVVSRALLGGVGLIQYRAKTRDRAVRQDEALQLLRLCRDHAVPLIINDDVELALAVGADGVHLGRSDGAIRDARQQLGASMLLGASCYADLSLALQAEAEGADYVAFGAFYPSSSKPSATPAPLSLLAEAAARLAVPVVAIGGIRADNAAPLVCAGADSLAVIDAICGASDPELAAQCLCAVWSGVTDAG